MSSEDTSADLDDIRNNGSNHERLAAATALLQALWPRPVGYVIAVHDFAENGETSQLLCIDNCVNAAAAKRLIEGVLQVYDTADRTAMMRDDDGNIFELPDPPEAA